jgi:hypothetical protein
VDREPITLPYRRVQPWVVALFSERLDHPLVSVRSLVVDTPVVEPVLARLDRLAPVAAVASVVPQAHLYQEPRHSEDALWVWDELKQVVPVQRPLPQCGLDPRASQDPQVPSAKRISVPSKPPAHERLVLGVLEGLVIDHEP